MTTSIGPVEYLLVRFPGSRFSGGVGGSFFDGLLRVDLAHGFNRPNDWRLHVNLNAQR